MLENHGLREVRRCNVLAALSLLPLLTLPSALAKDGSEVQPEISDWPDDVSYHPAYVGTRDHGYIDILAGWFVYQPDSDRILFVEKFVDSSVLEDPMEWGITCWLHATGTVEGESQDLLNLQWSRGAGGDEFSSLTEYGEISLDHDFGYNLTEPGYFWFSLNRAQLARYAAGVSDLVLACFEEQHIGSVSTDIQNMDEASSGTGYDWPALQANAGPDGSEDGAENSTSPPGGASEESGASSPALGFGSGLVAAVCLVVIRMRRNH